MAELEGTIEGVVFRNEDNGYTVLSLLSGLEEVTAVGTLPAFHPGERVRLAGQWSEHRTFGRQFKVESFRPLMPKTAEGVERYLSSGLIVGVGPAMARSIVHTFGTEALDILQMAPQRLSEVPGIGPRKAKKIAESFREQHDSREAILFLQQFGVTSALAMRIYKTYGGSAMQVLRENPYRLAEDVSGVGFLTADRIALSMGHERESAQRVQAGLLHVLKEAAAQDGHLFLPRRELCRQAEELLGMDEAFVEDALDDLVRLRRVTLDEPEDGEAAVYLPHFLAAEGEVAYRLNHIRKTAATKPVSDVEEAISRFEEEAGYALGQEQRRAVSMAVASGIGVITGGPGTGKTTVIRCILRLLRQDGLRVLLAAPTGRAAKRMEEAAGVPAKTIHRLLEFMPSAEDESKMLFQRDENNPLECDALVVDEMSMMDMLLMRALVRAVPPGCRLLMVGDVDQLPSVGAGDVLLGVIDSGVLPVVRMTQIYRQSEDSLIVVNAHRINAGEMPIRSGKKGDFFLERKEDVAGAADAAVDLASVRIPGFFGMDPMREIQVLCPMKKGDAGIRALNQRLQAALNPPGPGKAERQYGQIVFREGDKVMQVKNDYQAEWTRPSFGGVEEGVGVFNGDMGLIERIDPETQTVLVRMDDERRVEYDSAALAELELSYAVTIHKSQGSEFRAVVLLLHSGPPLLMTRNLLYTAVTRARELVVIVGRERTLQLMVRNNHVRKRFSRLPERLRAWAEEMGGGGTTP